MGSVSDNTVRMMTSQKPAYALTTSAFETETPSYALLACGSQRLPWTNDVSPRCGWTIGLRLSRAREDFAFENMDSLSHSTIDLRDVEVIVYTLGRVTRFKTRNSRMPPSREWCRFSDDHLITCGEVILNVLAVTRFV